MREVIGTTVSICPRCFKRIPATLYEEENKVFIEKTCPEHGKFRDLYWYLLNFLYNSAFPQ